MVRHYSGPLQSNRKTLGINECILLIKSASFLDANPRPMADQPTVILFLYFYELSLTTLKHKYRMHIPGLILLIALVWLTTWLLPLQAQIPGMKAYTQLDGYPGTVGYVMYQDEKGFIWIGTDNGAVAFDGKRFKVIDDRLGLVDKEILVAAPVKGGRVVCVPLLNNLSYYENGKVITALQDKQLRLQHNKTLNHAYRDMVSGDVWVSDNSNTSGQLLRISSDTIVAEQVAVKQAFYVLGVVNGDIYLQISERDAEVFGIYDLEKKQFDTLLVKTSRSTWGYLTDDGRYMVVNSVLENTIEAFEIKRGVGAQKLWTQQLHKKVKQIIIDINYHLWITYESGGVDYYDKVNTNNLLAPLFFLNDITINHVFTDRENNTWFTTKDKGLLFISERHWDNALLVKQRQLPDEFPLTICGDEQGRVYIGYKKPLIAVMDNGHTDIKQLPSADFGEGVRVLKNYKHTLCAAGNSMYFFNTNTAGLSLNSVNLVNRSIKDFHVLDKNRILVATHGEVLLVDPNAKITELNGAEFFRGRATKVCALPGQMALVGTPNGLYIQKGMQGKIFKINDPLLREVHITEIAPATNGYVLIGTSVKGLYSYHISSGSTRQIGIGKMPGTSYIRQIFFQNDSICWLATDRGVFRIVFNADLHEKELENYTFFDGLPSSNTTGVYVESDTLYVCTAAGIGILPLRPMKSHTVIPPVAWITTVRVGEEVWHFPSSLTLSHLQNDIQISLSAIAYESMGNVKYLYRLEGLSDKWIETESPDIGFSGLSPGEYRLMVKVVNFKGIISDKEQVVFITITPALWQTVWFKWAVGILSGGLVFLLIFRIVVSEKNRQYHKIQQKRRLAELELEAIKAQINPHFIYNCLNSIQYFSYKNDYEPVNRYLDIFAKLIRQTMQFSQETFITLKEETDYLDNYLKLEKIRFKEKLNYQIKVEEGLAPTTLVPAMLVQPYIENALKHGIARLDHTGEVWVSISETDKGWLQIQVEDNGPGIIQPSDNGKGKMGMRLAGSRAETYNQLFGMDIRVSVRQLKAGNNGLVKGTLVQLLIPPITYADTKV